MLLRIGEGKGPEEKAVENAIAKVSIWNKSNVRYERILDGHTNINWKIFVDGDEMKYFLKVPGKNTEIFIDRKAAYDASLKASNSGYSSILVDYIEEDQVEVFEFLDSFRSCTVADVLDREVRLNVIDAYQAIHQGENFILTKTGFDQIAEHVDQVAEHNCRLPADFEYFCWQTKRAEAAINAIVVDVAPCYNDGYITNYMVDQNKNIRIIDWEYGANNDPIWDLGCFALESFFSVEVRNEILAHYFGEARPEHVARMYLYSVLATFKWGLWATLQASISDIPFDFCKYSDLLLMRTRQGMRDWRWEEALISV